MSPQPAYEASFYVNPNAYFTTDPVKGTGTASRIHLQEGALLFIDNPYALVPTAAVNSGDYTLCSRIQCSRKIIRNANAVSCGKQCTDEVVWCNSECQQLGIAEHEFECSWLKTHAKSIRQEIVEEDFYTLWLIVRTLAQGQLEVASTKSLMEPASTIDGSFESNWNVVRRLRSNQELFQPQKLEYWRVLVERFLVGSHTKLHHPFDSTYMLTMTCQVETNHYDLWPKLIGIWPLPTSSSNPGESCYAYAMYLRTPFLNHSCIPNLMHQPDESGRMVFRAARNIAADEEFSVAYFDLAQPKYMDVKERRAYLESEFRFTCVCPRCITESGETGSDIL
ncbi:hypothetical protein BKA64DRAFT_654374 [Cadophora sp. MPI-SDFR-AT-0126]|nr:hypothetical protein BKA64DRAFT_654374 [Leotiomycetes sp. MPI-SDFR-AT-0126]